jgi:hypothetical protein
MGIGRVGDVTAKVRRVFEAVLIAAIAIPAFATVNASAAGVTAIHFTSVPIAAAGSMAPGGSVSFPVRVVSGGQPDPGGVVYLFMYSITAGAGYGSNVAGDSTTVPASQCGGVTQLTGSPIPCTANAAGQVMLTYHAPTPLPAQGRADWQAQNAASSPSITAVTHYVYSTEYRFSPSPIASSGSLPAGASVPITVNVQNGSDLAAANDTMFLSFTGVGSAAVGPTQLTSTPAEFIADGSGNVHVTYTAPLSLPGSGYDSITVQDLASPIITSSDSYAFSAATPVVSVGDVAVIEGDQHPAIKAYMTVTLSAAQSSPVSVSFFTLCGVGDKGCGPHNEDFVQVTPQTPQTVTIPTGSTSTFINVPQFSYIGGVGNCRGTCGSGENYIEGWYVELIKPVGAIIGRAVGEGVLIPDIEGVAKPLADLYIGNAGVVPVANGAHTPIYFSITLGGVEPSPVTFHYATADGNAMAGTDYLAAAGTGTIPAGATSVVIPVSVLPAAAPAANLTFTMTISNVSGGLATGIATGTGTLLSS